MLEATASAPPRPLCAHRCRGARCRLPEWAPAGTAFPSLRFSVCDVWGRPYSGGLCTRGPRWAACREGRVRAAALSSQADARGTLGEAPPRPVFLL